MSISSGLLYAGNNQVSGASWLDLSGNGNNIPLTNTSWETGGLQANANGELGTIDNTSEMLFNSEAGTLTMQFESLSAFADNTIRVLFGKFNSTHVAGDIKLYKFSNNILYFGIYDSSLHYIALNADKLTNWETGVRVSVLWDRANNIHDSKKMAFNIDGTHITPDASSNADAWNSFTVTNTLAMLNDISNTNNDANGISNNAYVFNTVKTEAELTAIATDHNIILRDYRGKPSYSIPIFFS